MNSALALFKLGDTYQHTVVVTREVMQRFLDISGDANPIHLDPDYAAAHGFRGNVVYGNFLGAMVSYVVGMSLPTKEVLLLSQNLAFHAPAIVGEQLSLRATVTGISEAVETIALRLTFQSSSGIDVCTGKCLVKCL